MSSQNMNREFLTFRDQCVWLQTALYESGADMQGLLTRSASRFFHDLNTILIEYVLLQISKITDPPESQGRENLTISNINRHLQAAGLLTQEITDASTAIMRYRDLIKESRNRVISHQDEETILINLPVGAHSESDVANFFKNLYAYVDAVGNAVGVGPLDFKTTAGSGDVLDLLRLLRRV
jgi:AbiU2